MPLFLSTRGKTNVAIGICDRCKLKMPLTDLMSDPNAPGLRVCKKDVDVYDPWRLPARQTEDISLQFPRPDDRVTFNASDNAYQGQYAGQQYTVTGTFNTAILNGSFAGGVDPTTGRYNVAVLVGATVQGPNIPPGTVVNGAGSSTITLSTVLPANVSGLIFIQNPNVPAYTPV
jgi:hypothetical protein